MVCYMSEDSNLPSGPVNSAFTSPHLNITCPHGPLWKSNENVNEVFLGFLINPCFQPNGHL